MYHVMCMPPYKALHHHYVPSHVHATIQITAPSLRTKSCARHHTKHCAIVTYQVMCMPLQFHKGLEPTAPWEAPSVEYWCAPSHTPTVFRHYPQKLHLPGDCCSYWSLKQASAWGRVTVVGAELLYYTQFPCWSCSLRDDVMTLANFPGVFE